MSQNKSAYFQNGQGKDNPNTPSPGKKKYKSEKALLVQPRFEEPLYRNYDTYDVPGVSDKPKHGPGAGWHDMEKYKSVKEFIEARRKKMKDKYKADDSWIEDDGSLSKKPAENSKLKTRAKLFAKIMKVARMPGMGLFHKLHRKFKDKNALDFQDDEYDDAPVEEGADNPAGQANEIGGYLDNYLPPDDFEGKSPTSLDYGRDYSSAKDCTDKDIKYNNGRDAYFCSRCGKLGFNGPYEPKPTVAELHSGKDYTLNDNKLDKLESKYLIPQESPLLGLPNGIEPKEDLDADKTVSNINPQYGTTDSGNQTYDKLSY